MKAQKIQWTALFILFFTYCGYATEVTSLGTGKWNDPTTWSNNAIPTANDNVTIMDGHTITIDADSGVVNNLIIGPGTAGGLATAKDKQIKLAIFGNLTLNAGMFFKSQTSSSGAALVHLIYLQGNITCNGSAFDMRNGSSATMGAANFIFFGSTVSTVTMGAYTTTNKYNNK
ncbi:MAG: G8 domain-containing protein [Ignavibacteriales bacterium]|nr:G8 domain-containing protein [Ignavibacteriales bacterium]